MYTRRKEDNAGANRNSGRYNTGQFVPANAPSTPARATRASTAAVANTAPVPEYNPAENNGFNNMKPENDNWENPSTADQWGDAGNQAPAQVDGSTEKKPHWMKIKDGGVKKSAAERRKTRNNILRKRITPKNALMVLNEMFPGESVSNNFVVEPADPSLTPTTYNASSAFCAKLSISGAEYKGYGINKMLARNNVAEQVFRDLIVKKLNSKGGGGDDDGEELPMIQLASFALHKLFEEWALDGHQIPSLISRAVAPPTTQVPMETNPIAPPKPPKVKTELPPNASTMHPTMLLNYMRSGAEYVELGIEGDKPHNQIFTLGVTIDNHTYIGKGTTKKEARKQAARTACSELFNVQFADPPAAV